MNLLKVKGSQDKVCKELKLSPANIKRLIGKLKPGCSAGQDGIEAEHLKYALDTDITLNLKAANKL